MTLNVIPTLRYVDAPSAIEWLCDALGFERNAVMEDGEGGIAHAQLTLGNGMIMIGSARDDEFGQLQRAPTPGEATTQSAYLVVTDIDAVFNSASNAGADIVLALRDTEYGSREFTCRDPQGHIWNVGTYDPMASA